MGYLGKRPATQGKDAGPALRLDDVSSNFDGLTTVFNLTVNGTAVAPHVNNIQVYLSGVHQLPGSSYTLSGSQIVFSGAPSSSLGFHGNVIGDSRLFIPDNDTVEPASFTANTISTISGSFISGFNYSGTISGSSTSTASFGRLEVAGNTNLTGDIEFDDVTATGNITSTGTNKVISGSVTSTGSFGRLQIDSTGSFGRVITSTADINGGTIDGITSLTSGGDLDIGAHDLRASTLTADSLTATRVPFAGTAGVLSDDSDLTFATATLSATNLTTTGTIKDFTSVSGSSVSTGSFGRVITSTADINGGTVDGITSLTAGGDLDIGAHDLRAETLTADSLTATRVPFAGTAGVLSDDSDLTFATATLSATNLTTTGTIKDFGLVSGSFVSTGSVGRVQTRTADIGIITGTSLTTSGNISGSTTSTGSFGRLQTQQDNASIGGNILTLAGNLTTTTGPGTIDFAADKTLTLNESLTVGDGHDGTLTFSAASKTLTVENTSVVNQDLTSDASPTFAGATITGTLTVQEIHTEFESASILFTSGSTQFGNSTDDVHNVTGSMKITGSFQVDNGTLTAGTVDINGGTIDGITSLTAGGDLDIGAHNLRAATITADGLTATRVPFAGTAGLLSDDSDLTFATATLSATNLTTTGTIKNMALVSGSSVSTGSFGRVQVLTADIGLTTGTTGSFGRAEITAADINGGTIDGITSLTAGGDLDIGAHDFRAATITADGLTATRVPFAGTAGLLSDDSDLTFATATLSATNLTTTGTIKNMALVSGSSVSTGSFGSIRSAGLPLRVSSDKVGIGTATPFVSHAGVTSTMKLHLNGGTAASSNIGDNPILLLENRAGSAGNRYGINFRMHAGQTFGMAEIGAITENTGAQESGGIYFATKQDTTGDSRPTEAMRIDDSGNVGIGTTGGNPLGMTRDLTINGTADISLTLIATNNLGDNTRGTQVNFCQGSSSLAVASIQAAQVGVTDGALASADLVFGTKVSGQAGGQPDEKMRIQADGKVGIGTVSPSQLLNVEAADGVSDNTWVTWLQNKEATDDRNYGLRISAGSTASDTAFFVQDHDASNDYFIIRGNGKVGIGTTSPDYLVEIEKANGDHTSTALSITNSQAGGYGSVLNFVSQRSDSTAHAVAASIRTQGEAAWDSDANTDSNLFFSTVLDNTLADKMKLNAAGNLDIGGRAYNSSTGGFYMNDGRIQNTITANSSGYEVMMFDNTTENGTVALLQYRTNAAAEGSIIADGSGLAISNNSDYRKKERITDLEGSLDAINSLQPRKYYYRKEFAKPRRAFAGFIAHEVQESQLPHLTTGVKDGVVTQEDLDNDLHSEKIVGDPAYQTVSYSGNEMITRLVGAVQELSEKVEAQQKEIEELKN